MNEGTSEKEREQEEYLGEGGDRGTREATVAPTTESLLPFMGRPLISRLVRFEENPAKEFRQGRDRTRSHLLKGGGGVT